MMIEAIVARTHLEMLHKDGNDNVDEDELSQQNKANEEDGRYERTDAAVAHAGVGGIAVVEQSVLRDVTINMQLRFDLGIQH